LAVLSTVYHYNHWIYDSVREFLGSEVVEIGAGVGNITQFLLRMKRVGCLEPYPEYLEYLRVRFAAHQNVSIHALRIEDCPNAEVPPNDFDSAICLNVLEHIPDDVDALRRIGQLIRPGGRVVVLVPAMPFLYGEMDRAMGHLRRYTLSSLRRAFQEAGLRPVRGWYMNLPGVLGWWWRGRVRRKTTIPESLTRRFDRLVPFISAVERLIRPLVGQSAIVVATRDA
jgi:SAM-dependent methyltransferase